MHGNEFILCTSKVWGGGDWAHQICCSARWNYFTWYWWCLWSSCQRSSRRQGDNEFFSSLNSKPSLSLNFEAEICAIMSRTIGQNQTDSAESELATGIMMRVVGSCVELYMKIASAGNQRYPAGEVPSGHQIWIRGLSRGEMGCTRRPRVSERSLWGKLEEIGCGLHRPLLPTSHWSHSTHWNYSM